MLLHFNSHYEMGYVHTNVIDNRYDAIDLLVSLNERIGEEVFINSFGLWLIKPLRGQDS